MVLAVQDINEHYEYFYQKKFDSFKYRYKPSEKAFKTIDNFLGLIKKHYPNRIIGKTFLWNYFVFQFNYWEDLTIEAFHGQFNANLVIGVKAFKRFLARSVEHDYIFETSEIIQKYNLKKSELNEKPIELSIHRRYEVPVKTKYHNTDKGFATCIKLTSLYDHVHLICLRCNYSTDCKKLLKTNNPELYDARGYSANKSAN